jgi:ATP-dependent helicase HrpB
VQLDLPIHELGNSLRNTWRNQRNLVLVAPTGSGKTTQVCQLLYADGVLNGKRIVVLQPRRVAARSVATRVAQEMGVEVGELVGYQVRFDDKLTDATEIAFVTEGILLRWLQNDPTLANIGAVLFDEFHERNLLSDIALALCKQLQRTTRPDMLLIVMSATLEAAPVAAYLDAPILESQGRSYPVQIRYQDWDDDAPVWERAADKVQEILRDTPDGDVLVFMPGMFEIQRTIEEIRRNRINQNGVPPVVLALHGELPPREQDRVFAPSGYRRVIVATNVAETSITIPSVRYVVDSGQARIARYQASRGVNTLTIEPISQASADQRAGRAGRVAPGIAFRLWSQKNNATRPLKNTPEAQRTELSSVVLQLHALGVADVTQFDFLDKPSNIRIRAADELLLSMGAIAAQTQGGYGVTDVGRHMLQIPVHPRYARMLIEAQHYNCVRDVALMAALVNGRDLLTRIDRNDKTMRRNRESLIKKSDRASDYFLLANAFRYAVENDFDGKACFAYGINAHVAREVNQTYAQLTEICIETGLLEPDRPDAVAAAEAIARCHLVGFVDHLAVRTGTGSDEYDLIGGKRYTLMDESIIGRNMLIVASELREIATRNGSTLNLLGFGSAVEVAWVRELNPPGLNEQVEYVYDRLHKRVVAGRVLRYRDLLIGGERVETLEPSAAARVLAEEFADQLHKLPQWPTLKPMVARLHGRKRADLVAALAAAWHGATTHEQVMKLDVVPAIRDLVNRS